MLPFDKEFQSGEAKITQVRLDLLLADNTPLHLTEEHVMMGGFIRDTSTTVDGKFTIGAAVTGKLTVLIDNTDQSLSGYDFRGAIITAKLGGESSPDVFQLLQVGIYTVDDYKYDGSVITLTAYDNLYKFDEPCSNTSVTFPITLENLVRQACTVAGVSLANVSIPNGSYSITKEPPQWKTMTWHDVIAYCAQIACCFAKALPDGRLFFSWYDAGLFNEMQIDGGTFDTNTTPYSDGGAADGGDFDYGSTQSFDGGSFDDRENVHVLGQLFDLSVDTDDVLITGISVTLAASDNINAVQGTQEYTKTLGTSAYLIKISNNPLIETTANADSVCAYLYNLIVGMRFRPLESSVLENPAVEAGDNGVVVDRYDNTYICFISHATYTTGAATRISCDAESPMNNLKARYSEAQKTQALAQRTFERAVLDADAAMQMIMSAYATTMGLYQYTESDGQDGTIYIYGNKNTLASSDIRWKFSAGALMVSSDYGRTWNAAISAEGIAVFQEVYAIKISADNIVTGTMTIGGTSGNKDGSLIIKDANGNVIGTFNKNGISVKGSIQSGSTISGASISGGSVSGSAIVAGGINNASGTIKIYDENGALCGEINKEGASVNGILMSYKNNGYASKIKWGRMYFYGSGTHTYEQIKNAEWDQADGCISGGKNGTTSGALDLLGLYILSAKQFIAIGKETGQNSSTSYYTINLTSGPILGHYERHIFSDNVRFLNNLYLKSSINFNNPSVSSSYTISWRTFSNNDNYAYIGYFENTNRFELTGSGIPSGVGLLVSSLGVIGTKNRIVETKHYGSVGMNAFETASSHFADIGSGTVGDDGTVTIFFDPVFEETIDTKADYQVFITRTSELETAWVDKRNGYFIVHGVSGATFDWMIVGYQRDYITNRMEHVDTQEQHISDDPIVTEDTSSVEAVEQMVEKYNEELEDLDND